MKFLNPLIIVFAFLLSACSEDKEVPTTRLVERNGITYEVNSNVPFNGKAIEQYANGQNETVSVFDDGKLTLFESYYRNGQLNKTTNYKAGILNGTSKSYYENGQLKEVENYKNGYEEGIFDAYFQNGQLRRKRTYSNGEPHGFSERYFDNGILRSKGNYIEGFKDGIWEFFYETGQLEQKGNLIKDKKEGVWISYFQIGQLEAKGSYRNDILDGPFEEFFENGQLKFKGSYKNGKKEGPFEEFFENGQLKFKGSYKNGKKEGPFEEFFEDSQLKFKGSYKNGSMEGPWEVYYSDGTLNKDMSGTYENGDLVKDYPDTLVIYALSSNWIEIEDASDNTVLAKLLLAGEFFNITSGHHTITTGNAGGLVIGYIGKNAPCIILGEVGVILKREPIHTFIEQLNNTTKDCSIN